ncbi:MAG TPA: MYG1 family protein [Baekduia sp.]|uniref:MYG1 family protein n=1 Tax=Baekduia sp. TaxID=2600305 RepID=UPI002D771AA0|nr:MYG1 family protein [Baekduia sp.]HET6509364.1 MYG1 family protein [Baekduia sp.]
MRVATHPGGFHADDVFAVAALRLAHPDEQIEVVRTRDAARQAAADVRVDVGGRDDASTGDFDHHQKGGAGERPNGIRYASFGLVWRAFGAAICGGSQEAADGIDERLVQGVDANDTGQTIMESLVDGVRPMTVSGVVGALNPSWDERLDQAEEDARFAEAVAVAQGILERQVAGAAGFQRARELVRAAIAAAAADGGDPRVVELSSNMPWRETMVNEAPDARLVVYPKSDGWGMVAVPVAPGAFDNRMDLPAAWAGLTGDELAAATGVDDALFAHTARFYASAGSREGVLALARAALADADGEADSADAAA